MVPLPAFVREAAAWAKSPDWLRNGAVTIKSSAGEAVTSRR
jgi:hypothetical protein